MLNIVFIEVDLSVICLLIHRNNLNLQLVGDWFYLIRLEMGCHSHKIISPPLKTIF